MSNELSERELKALQLTAEGCIGKDVAERMELALGSIRICLSSVQHKLKAKTISHAIAIAYAKGILGGDRTVTEVTDENRKGVTYCAICHDQIFDIEEHIRTPEHERKLKLRNKAEEHITERIVNIPIVKLDTLPPDRGVMYSRLPDGREMFVVITGLKVK